jgi:hypothetical protein
MRNLTAAQGVVIAIILMVLGGMASCKKSNNNSSMGTFYFHIHTDIDTSEVDDTTCLVQRFIRQAFRAFGSTILYLFL